MKKIRLLIILHVIAALCACSSIDCKLNGTVLCHYVIQTSDGEDATFAYPVSVTLNRKITNGDTVYIDQQANASYLDLPMSYDGEVDDITLTLSVDSATVISDQIHISKTNEPYLESVDCAARFNHTITGVEHTSNFIQEIIINNPKVTNDGNVTNIIIRVADSY